MLCKNSSPKRSPSRINEMASSAWPALAAHTTLGLLKVIACRHGLPEAASDLYVQRRLSDGISGTCHESYDRGCTLRISPRSILLGLVKLGKALWHAGMQADA